MKLPRFNELYFTIQRRTAPRWLLKCMPHLVIGRLLGKTKATLTHEWPEWFHSKIVNLLKKHTSSQASRIQSVTTSTTSERVQQYLRLFYCRCAQYFLIHSRSSGRKKEIIIISERKSEAESRSEWKKRKMKRSRKAEKTNHVGVMNMSRLLIASRHELHKQLKPMR